MADDSDDSTSGIYSIFDAPDQSATPSLGDYFGTSAGDPSASNAPGSSATDQAADAAQNRTDYNVGSSNTGNNAQLDWRDKGAVENYIRAGAQSRGINPDYAVATAYHEGMNGYVGDKNSSFGPYQLHYGGVAPGMMQGGMGDDFTKATGLNARDPSSTQAQIDFALDHVANHGWGAWNGAKALGITGKMGIGGNGSPIDVSKFLGQQAGRGGSSAGALAFSPPTTSSSPGASNFPVNPATPGGSTLGAAQNSPSVYRPSLGGFGIGASGLPGMMPWPTSN